MCDFIIGFACEKFHGEDPELVPNVFGFVDYCLNGRYFLNNARYKYVLRQLNNAYIND